MSSEIFIRRAFNSKVCFFSIFMALFALLQVNTLEAKGWGKTHETLVYEGTKWNGVYFDMNKLSFTALIPNYSGAVLNNDEASLSGEVKKEAQYTIITSVNGKFSCPKTEKKFVEMIQKANHGFIVEAINCSELGARFAVDLRPKKQEYTAFWRFLVTKDRLIKMGTDDLNVNRRNKFFESIKIR